MKPERLELALDYLDPERERFWIDLILSEFSKHGSDSQRYPGAGGRSRVLRYGWSIEGEKKWLRDIPFWTRGDSVVVNEYLPGSFIGPHIDPGTCDNEVAIVSLASDCDIVFASTDVGRSRQFSMHIPRRSLLVMADDARWFWTHEIPSVKETRYSIVFRKRL